MSESVNWWPSGIFLTELALDSEGIRRQILNTNIVHVLKKSWNALKTKVEQDLRTHPDESKM